MLYGHNNVAVYDKKSDMRVKVDYDTYDFLLNETGFVPKDSLTLYFGINDFATRFVDDIGNLKDFGLLSQADGVSTVKGGNIYIPFETEVYSGTAVVPIERGTVRKDFMVEDVDRPTRPCLSVAYNPVLARSFATDYRDGFFSLNLYCDYDATHGNRVSYHLHGGVLYSDFFENASVRDRIRPNAGDVIEINYHTDGVDVEQYEITEVISRKPTNTDGISPLLGTVVYKCTAVRRIPSHEDAIAPEDGTKREKKENGNFSKERAEAIDDTYDWSSRGKSYKSNIYGGYAKADSFYADVSGNFFVDRDSVFDYDQFRYDWPDSEFVKDGRYRICEFTDGSALETDGVNLKWVFKDGYVQDITKVDPKEVVIKGGKIPQMMYIRVINGQIVFYTADMNQEVWLTNFLHPQADDFQYFEGFAYKDVGYVSNEGYYIFKNNRIALNSFDGRFLVAFNAKGNEQFLVAERTA